MVDLIGSSRSAYLALAGSGFERERLLELAASDAEIQMSAVASGATRSGPGGE